MRRKENAAPAVTANEEEEEVEEEEEGGRFDGLHGKKVMVRRPTKSWQAAYVETVRASALLSAPEL